MSSKFAGVTFDEQAATPSDDAIIRRAILDDGILTGCEFSYTGSTLTMTAGQLMICGRQVKHPSTQNWAVSDATTGFARLLLTIDLTRTSSKDTFEQVVDTIEYASAVDGFADLVQDDINASGTKYQIVAAVVSLASGGISGIVSQLAPTSAALGDKSVIIAKAPTGSTVTCSKGDIIKRTIERNGEWRFNGLDLGTWRINASINGLSTYTDVKITEFGVYRVTMAYQLYPDDFEWSGTKGVDYEIVQDDDTVIPVEDYRRYLNWKARILTTITITPQKNGYVDVFALGGGGSGGFSGNSGPTGSGGGSGYAITYKKVFVEANVPITITIGAGGTYPTTDMKGNDGGETSFGELKAAGGIGGGNKNNPGGNGGSGGNGKWADETMPEERGIDGSDGYKRGTGRSSTEPGKGQKNQSGPNGETGNTREFGDPSGKLYAYGGYASGIAAAKPKEANTGDGGDSGGNTKVNNGAGASGIVVFRNAREGVA